MEVIKQIQIAYELTLRVERDIPAWVHSRVDRGLVPEGARVLHYEITIDDDDLLSTIDKFSERYLAPVAEWITNRLADIRAEAGADKEIVFYELGLPRVGQWAERITSPRVSLLLHKRWYGDNAHISLLYMVRDRAEAVAA